MTEGLLASGDRASDRESYLQGGPAWTERTSLLCGLDDDEQRVAQDAMLGAPELDVADGDVDVEVALMAKRLDERRASLGTDAGVTDLVSWQGHQVTASAVRFDQLYIDLGAGGFDQRDLWQLADAWHRAMADIDELRGARASIAGMGATVASIAAATVVMAALGPAAGVALTTVLAGVAGGLAAAAVGEVVRGSTTTSEDRAHDFASGAVEGALCGLGAGLGAKAMKATEATLGASASRVAGPAVEGLVDGMLGGAGGEVFATLTDEATWDLEVSGVLAAVLAAAARGALLGGLTGGAMSGALGAIAARHGDEAASAVGEWLADAGVAAERLELDEAGADALVRAKLLADEGRPSEAAEVVGGIDLAPSVKERLWTLLGLDAALGPELATAGGPGGMAIPESGPRGPIEPRDRALLDALYGRDAQVTRRDLTDDVASLGSGRDVPDHAPTRLDDDDLSAEAGFEGATVLPDRHGTGAVSRTRAEPKIVKAGASSADVLEELERRTSFPGYGELLEEVGVERADLEAAIDDYLQANPGGVDLDKLRHHLKVTFREEVYDALDAAEHAEMLELLDGVPNADKGNLGAYWYVEHHASQDLSGVRVEVGIDPTATYGASGPVPDLAPGRLDILGTSSSVPVDEELLARLKAEGYSQDFLDDLAEKAKDGAEFHYGAIREVKSGGIGAEDLERAKNYMRLVIRKPPAVIDGVQASKLELVLMDPTRARKSMEDPKVVAGLEKLFDKGKGRFTVQVFDASGTPHTARSMDEIRGVLGR